MLANKWQITDIKEATRLVLMTLRNELGDARAILDSNMGRYKILIFDTEAILIAYKREMYLKFEEGRGETLNKEDLIKAMEKYKIKRVFIIYADSKIYTISPMTIISQAIERTTEAEQKEVYSFPVKLLIRYNDFNKSEELIHEKAALD